MTEKFKEFSEANQSYKIWKALSPKNVEAENLRSSFSISDIFNTLPHSITYKGKRGDLAVTTQDIAYFSIDGDWKHILVHHEPIPIGGDVYDAFANMIVWLKANNLWDE